MAILTNSGRTWRLEGLVPHEHLKLLDLPGLRLSKQQPHWAEGGIDAVGAACNRISTPMPIMPAATTVNANRSLYPFQQDGVARCVIALKIHGGVLLADEMGLGKTRQAIAVAQELCVKDSRILVVCPAYLRSVWSNELQTMEEKSVAVLGPKTNKRTKKAWVDAETARYVVTSYELASQALDAAFKRTTPKFLIVDEAQMIRGRDAKRSKKLEDVANLCPYRMAITGTPAWGRPRDYFQLLKLLFRQSFGNQYDFDRAYAAGFTNEYGGVDNRGASNLEELRLRLSYYMVRRLKSEVAKELPSLTRQVIWLDAVAGATQAFHQAMASRNGRTTSLALEATLRHKARAAMQLAVDAKQFLLFTWMRSHAAEMHATLNEDLETPCELITGDVPADKRQSIIDRAAANKHGIVATIDSMQAGVNAQHVASQGIFHAIDYTHSKLLQAEARIHRIGSGLPVQWTYLALRDSYDELVVKTVVAKLDSHRAVLGDGKDFRDTLDESSSGGQTEEDYLRSLYDGASDDDVKGEDNGEV